MNKGVFLCVGTGGHVLPAYNVIKSMLDQGIDKKNILHLKNKNPKIFDFLD